MKRRTLLKLLKYILSRASAKIEILARFPVDSFIIALEVKTVKIEKIVKLEKIDDTPNFTVFTNFSSSTNLTIFST